VTTPRYASAMKLALAAIALAATVVHADPAHRPKVKSVTIDYKYTSFHRNELHYVIEAKPGGGFQLKDKAVDSAVVDALYAALTGLHSVDSVERCISHTDDYPSFKIAIDGERPIELASDSNCHLGVPWIVTEHGKLAAQYNGAIGIALHQLLAAIDSGHWKTGPDSPEALMGLGGERVRLDDYTAGDPAGTPAAACAKTIETDPRIHVALGEDIHISMLLLACDLGTSPECTLPTATASFLWQGFAATFEFPCLNGKVDFTKAVAADLTDLRAFLESKPMRVLKGLATKPPRVDREGPWVVETWREDLPALQYAPGRLVVEARAVSEHGPGAAFWKALGIDPKPLTQKDAASFITSATLDFAGKLVK